MKTFVVPGKPQGYYAQGAHPNWDRFKQYNEYKKKVCLIARAAGIELPLHSTAERPLFIAVFPFFASGVHCDPGNVQKGVVDALFWSPKGSLKKGSDKHTAGYFPWPAYDKHNPRVIVDLYWGGEISKPLMPIPAGTTYELLGQR